MNRRIFFNALLLLLFFCSCRTQNTESTIKDDSEWSFIVFGDVQRGIAVFNTLSDLIGKIDPSPLAAVCVGDMVLRTCNQSEWEEFDKAAEPIRQKMPLFLVRGNHEGNDPDLEDCLHKYGRINSPDFYYTKSVRDAFFIILDTYEKGMTNEIGEKQVAWLEQVLDSASQEQDIRNIFIFMHHPVFQQGSSKGQTIKNADELHRLFISHKKIRAVFAGHNHLFNRYVKDGMNYIISGGAGGELIHGYGGDYHHFLRISFYTDTARVNVKVINAFSKIVESFDLQQEE
jgi:hypothetical protein